MAAEKRLHSVAVLTCMIGSALGSLRIFMDPTTTERYLGFHGELVLVHNSLPHRGALDFVYPIPPGEDELVFSWHNTNSQSPITFSAELQYQRSPALSQAQFVSETGNWGNVPTSPKAIKILAPCIAGSNGQADVNLQLNFSTGFTSNPNADFDVVVHITRYCQYVSPATQPPPLQSTPEQNREEDVSKHTVLYASVSVTIVVIIATAVLIAWISYGDMQDRRVVVPDMDSASSDLSSFQFPGPKPASSDPSTLSSATVYRHSHSKTELQHRLRNMLIPFSQLSLGEDMVRGTYGRICSGILKKIDSSDERVIVKTLLDMPSQEKLNVFLSECSVYRRLQHDHILSLAHIALDSGYPPCAVYRAPAGFQNLKVFLVKRKASESGPMMILSTRDVLSLALQICKAMLFLSRRKIVHRDIAARNCVIDASTVLKLTDSTLSRDLFPEDYHILPCSVDPMPVRWMAVESLEGGQFTYSSDIWSYGVLLWEITTLGTTPYTKVEPTEMGVYLLTGCRLPQPCHCPDELFTVMAGCWALLVSDRPKWRDVQSYLEIFQEKLNTFI